jgi:flagellar biosynthesis/type III secretory pathway chaperone
MNNRTQKSFDELAEELFIFMDDNILSIGRMLEQLTQLRAAVIRRDEKSLTQMLGNVSGAAAQRTEMQQRQRQLCEIFATRLNCRVEDVNVSYLAGFLEEDRKKNLKTRQQTLRQLTVRLSLEHKATERLLRECMHLNRKLLECIVGRANPALTYGQGGRIQREMQYAMMSFKM